MDKSITQLTALTTADQADVYPIVDVSASETKKITQNNLEDTIANSSNFVDGLVANTYFIDEVGTTLANDTNFIDELTQNTNFQNAVNNFTTGGGAGGLSTLTQTFSFSDFVDDGSGNGIATFTDDLPEDAVPVGVVYEITSAFDATSTLKVINSVAGGIVIGASVDATIANVLSGQTDGSNTSFDFGATPNPVVYIAGLVPTQGAVTVTVLYSTSQGVSGGSKKVGVGEISDINWFNIQLPFSMVDSTNAESNVWDIQASGLTVNPSFVNLSDAEYFSISSDQQALLPDFTGGAADGYKFNSNLQAIFSCMVYTTADVNSNKGGIGFTAIGTNAIITAQGGNALSVGFVRSTAGQWYARCATGAAFTETAITVTDGIHVFRCEYDPGNATPQARFYVDGILLATITTNVPSAINTVVGWSAGQNTTTQIALDTVGCPSFAVEI